MNENFLQNNKLVNDLVSLIPSSNTSKSSYWKYHTENQPTTQINNILNDYWSIKERSYKNILIYGIFNFFVFLFDLKIIFSKSYKLVREACIRTKRLIDFDAFRHAISINIIFKKVEGSESFKKICVIGDGKTNVVGPLLCSKVKNLKIISVNLPEALVHDYLVLANSDLIDLSKITIANSEDEIKSSLKENETKLILVAAQNAKILKKQDIDLFINIHSFQEMTQEIIKEYFEIISSNAAYFYCENRESKKLYGGELIEFDNYPWMEGKRIIYDYVNWGNWYYNNTFPYLRRMKDLMKYTIVKY